MWQMDGSLSACFVWLCVLAVCSGVYCVDLSISMCACMYIFVSFIKPRWMGSGIVHYYGFSVTDFDGQVLCFYRTYG